MDKNCAKSKHIFVRSDLMAKIIKNSICKKKRGEKQIDDFRSKLGFKLHDITMNKGELVTTKKVKSIFKLKQTTTTICLKLSN